MKSSPRNFRLSEDALKALKVLEGASPNTSRGEIVSKAIVSAAKGIPASPQVQFRLLDPAQYLHLQASLSEIESLHRKNRDALLKIRPADKGQAEKLAQATKAIDDETNKLTNLRQQLANLARTTESLTAEDHQRIANVIRWTMARMNHENTKPEHKPTYALQLRILQSLIP